MRTRPHLAMLAFLAGLALSCGLEKPNAIVDHEGCVSDDDCKGNRICQVPFGRTEGTCEYPDERGDGGGGGSGGTGGSGGSGGTGGAGGGNPDECEIVCAELAPCLEIPHPDCVQLCPFFGDACIQCSFDACDAGQDPTDACFDLCF